VILFLKGFVNTAPKKSVELLMYRNVTLPIGKNVRMSGERHSNLTLTKNAGMSHKDYVSKYG
jgi:hypothetical protein